MTSLVYEPFQLKKGGSKMEDIKPNILYEREPHFVTDR